MFTWYFGIRLKMHSSSTPKSSLTLCFLWSLTFRKYFSFSFLCFAIISLGLIHIRHGYFELKLLTKPNIVLRPKLSPTTWVHTKYTLSSWLSMVSVIPFSYELIICWITFLKICSLPKALWSSFLWSWKKKKFFTHACKTLVCAPFTDSENGLFSHECEK